MVSIACAAGRQATPYRPRLLLATVGVRQGQARRELTPGHAAFSQFGLVRWQTIDMPQTYWLDLFRVETWQEFLDHGGDVTGFREKRWKTVQKIKHGDYLLCYLTGASRWVGLLEVTSEPVYDEAVKPVACNPVTTAEPIAYPAAATRAAARIHGDGGEDDDEGEEEDC